MAEREELVMMFFDFKIILQGYKNENARYTQK
jgi:hypothetical protein